jgi:hypothetical protein
MTADERLKICENCPLWEVTDYGPVCSKKKYINSEQKTSLLKKDGYVKGCGCKLLFKTKNPKEHCIVGLW